MATQCQETELSFVQSAEFTYEPLPIGPRMIRLLCLEPATSPDDDLRATFILADLDDAQRPDYEALSYVWGNSGFSEGLAIDGRGRHPITANLSQSLIALRKVDSVRLLWVDAVCINQETLQEKSQQIRLMGHIYKYAKTVLIWLGPHEYNPLQSEYDSHGEPTALHTTIYRHGKRIAIWPGRRFVTVTSGGTLCLDGQGIELTTNGESASVMMENGQEVQLSLGKPSSAPMPTDAMPLDGLQVLQRFAEEQLAVDSGDLHLYPTIQNESTLFHWSMLDNTKLSEIFRYMIEEVYTNPWFRRMWIVQEVCLAPRAVLFHRGREMDWEDFSLAMTLLWTTTNDQVSGIPCQASFEQAYGVVKVVRLYKAATIPGRTAEQQLRSVSRVSQALRGQQCQLEHDRIYALLNLQPDGSPLKTFVSDYGQPLLQVFRSFAAKSLSLGMVEILYDAGLWERKSQHPSTDHLPSWVPDFRYSSKSSQLPWLKQYFLKQLSTTMTKPPETVLPFPAAMDDGNPQLTVDVLTIDKIKVSMPSENFPSTGEFKFGQRKESCFKAVLAHVRKCRKMYRHHKNARAYSKTLSPLVDSDTPFWCSLAAFSEHTGTPVFPDYGSPCTKEHLLSMIPDFQRLCLDKRGEFTNGEDALAIDRYRPGLLERMGEIKADFTPKQAEVFRALTYYDIVRRTMDNIPLFITERGFVGLAPPTQLLGNDVIAMIKGAPIPFILRPLSIKNAFLIVGSCYVFGFMDIPPTGSYRSIHLL
ncbi:HET-domain-containing protein [Paramyrothecium foliicola]|nr:HET-domain-containing protein [Paramyrothecium foliicola]